jgi:hypothetical protein
MIAPERPAVGSMILAKAMSAFPPLLGAERTSVGQPLNEYTA